MSRLPKPHEARQLCRLRALRVQRARERAAEAQAEVERATAKAREQQRRIDGHRRDIDRLSHAVVHELAPHLPRWKEMVAAQQAALIDRLERAESALIDDEHELEQAQERLQQARAEVTRALAQEDAVRGIANEAQRARRVDRESRAERDLEDLGRPPAAMTGQPA
jgi:hypothetical protein